MRRKLAWEPRGGVVDEDADPAELLRGLADGSGEIVVVADVALDGDGAAAGREQRLARGVQRFQSARGDRDIGTMLCEGERDRATDPLRAAGHECNLALQRKINRTHGAIPFDVVMDVIAAPAQIGMDVSTVSAD